MKKLISIFILSMFLTPCVSEAITVKKKAAVSTKKTEALESATSLLPSVIGLVQDVKNIKAQQDQLTSECTVTSEEIRLVNDMIKEWAKIGDSSTDNGSIYNGLGEPCRTDENSSDDGSYQSFMQNNPADVIKTSCYERFVSQSDKLMIWYKYPKASKASICPPGDNKNCNTVSNVYEVFDKVPFTDEDYTKEEARRLASLKQKAEKCSPSKIKAAQRQIYGEFLTKTIGNVGQSSGASGTAAVIQAVSSIGAASDNRGMINAFLPSLGQMAMQTADK